MTDPKGPKIPPAERETGATPPAGDHGPDARHICGPCELGETQGSEVSLKQILEYLKSKKNYIIFGLIFSVALVSLFNSGLDALINSQLFFPERRLAGTPDQYGMTYKNLAIETKDGVHLHGWWIPAPSPKAVLLFFHGNAGNISHRLENLKLLQGLGLSCVIVDYRGYGMSQGSPNEKGFYLDALAAYGAAAHYAQGQQVPLLVFGRSLGGAAALEVANGPAVKGVILESTFTNLGAMAKAVFHLPGSESLFSGRFDSLARIELVKAPLLFFHGDQDHIVPHRLGRELYERAGAPKEFVTLRGAGHNDTISIGGRAYLAKIADFVDSLALR